MNRGLEGEARLDGARSPSASGWRSDRPTWPRPTARADDGLNGRTTSGACSSKAGATRWSLPEEFGGAGCPRPLLVQRYAQLAGGSLTAVFILSQHDAGVRRLHGRARK